MDTWNETARDCLPEKRTPVLVQFGGIAGPAWLEMRRDGFDDERPEGWRLLLPTRVKADSSAGTPARWTLCTKGDLIPLKKGPRWMPLPETAENELLKATVAHRDDDRKTLAAEVERLAAWLTLIEDWHDTDHREGFSLPELAGKALRGDKVPG